MNNNWRKYQGALVSNFSPHSNVDISNIISELKKSRSMFARWVTDFDCKDETDFWYVIQDRGMGISDYSRNTRNQIRKGLKIFIIKQVSVNEIKKNAYIIYLNTFKKYNTFIKVKTIDEFELEILPTMDYWGVYVNDELVGYAQNRIYEDCCDYATIKILPKYIRDYPFYALFYTMNLHYLKKLDIKYVHNGARSIAHYTNIQDFLIKKFKFRKAYCKLHIVYSPVFGFLVKLFFPFRSIIKYFSFNIFRKLDIILKQEEIRRDCKKQLPC